jgi:hypothetical protein
MFAKMLLYLLALPIRLCLSAAISLPATIENSSRDVNNGTPVVVPDLTMVNLGLTAVVPMSLNKTALNSLKIPYAQKSEIWRKMSGSWSLLLLWLTSGPDSLLKFQ